MRVLLSVVLALAGLMACAPAHAEPRQLNPPGTTLEVRGKLYLDCATNRACMNVPINTDHPDGRQNGHWWIKDDGASIHNICFRSGDNDYCVNAAAE